MSVKGIAWDFGSGYDLFISLHVLHNPEKFGLRGSWSAGVRSRLSVNDRKVLELADHVVRMPFSWLYSLPAPKDSQTVVSELERISPQERLEKLVLSTSVERGLADLLVEVGDRKGWREKDLDVLKTVYRKHERSVKTENLMQILDAWSQKDEFGEQYLEALQDYCYAFFSEEERRIQPILKKAVEGAQELSRKLDLPELLEELSQGVRFSTEIEGDELILVPSFWTTPLIILNNIDENRRLFVFGGRPADISLVPGEAIPDTLLSGLKALADPTRLRILRYLSKKPLTTTQLARRLRLRAPTVIHHLNELRLSGLVQLTIDLPEKKGERRYAARSESVQRIYDSLQKFLAQDDQESTDNKYPS